jgi:hypothetical protein
MNAELDSNPGLTASDTPPPFMAPEAEVVVDDAPGPGTRVGRYILEE